MSKYHREIPFYIYSSQYFLRWDKSFSERVLSSIAEISSGNTKALRTLAYRLEANGKFEKAQEIYQKIHQLSNNRSVQSFLDLARIYEENGLYKKSFEMCKIILNNQLPGLDFTRIVEQTETLLQRISNQHRLEIAINEFPQDFLVVKHIPLRIVIDWNDPNAEFEIQFVNPDKKYFTWTRKFEDDSKTIKDAIKNGVLSKEFTIDNNISGEWIINIISFSQSPSSKNPAYMKYTLYRNYGLPDETKEIRFIKLYNQTQKVTLDKFTM